jgi:hypothetical protein
MGSFPCKATYRFSGSSAPSGQKQKAGPALEAASQPEKTQAFTPAARTSFPTSPATEKSDATRARNAFFFPFCKFGQSRVQGLSL